MVSDACLATLGLPDGTSEDDWRIDLMVTHQNYLGVTAYSE